MKKVLSMIMVLALCLSLCACGNNKEKVKNSLQGTWKAKWSSEGKNLSRYYSFEGESYTTGGVAYFGELEVETGIFEINDSCIHLIPDDGSEPIDLVYTFDKTSGEIELWWADEIPFEKVGENSAVAEEK